MMRLLGIFRLNGLSTPSPPALAIVIRDLDEINFNPITFWLKDPCPFLLLLQFLTFPSVPASCILLRCCPLFSVWPVFDAHLLFKNRVQCAAANK